MTLRVIATKLGKLLECDDGVEIVSNGHLPTKSDILRHFVHLRASPDPPIESNMIRLVTVNIIKL